eukprot:730621-Karenia_brevis.AAC.1
MDALELHRLFQQTAVVRTPAPVPPGHLARARMQAPLAQIVVPGQASKHQAATLLVSFWLP